jgi:asparagine synthase (glutamine-hydrolysing)
MVGAHGPGGGGPPQQRLRDALAQRHPVLGGSGPLRVAHTGPPELARDGSLCVLDGYLDNLAALREELGLEPNASQQAVLVAGWRRWEAGLLVRLRGDFALLLWDLESHRGLLARDQLGVRSLFLHQLGATLCFANEVRLLLSLLARTPAPDPVGVAHWVAGRGRSGSGTLHAGIRRLEPGCALLLDRGAAREWRYWAPRFREPDRVSAEEAALRVRDALDSSVRRRLDPTAPTGVLMSGGLDSATVAACASALAPGSVVAYSGVFPDHRAVDESELIDRLRAELALAGVTAGVRAGGLLASALESQRAWGSPLVGWGEFWALPLLRHAAANGVNVMLGGDGGDEVFQVRSYLVADRLRAGRPLGALGLVRQLPGAALGPSTREVATVTANLAAVGGQLPRLHELIGRPLGLRDYPAWLRPHLRARLRESDDPLAWKRLDGPRWWAHAAHAVTRGVEELGVFESLRRTAMLAGVDARHPLFDLDLVQLMLEVAPSLTFDRRLDRPLLRASMKGRVPDSVRLRPRKAMFDSLIADSLMGTDGDVVRALLSDPAAELGQFVDLQQVARDLLVAPQDTRRPFRSTQYLWRLVTAELWLREQAGSMQLAEGMALSEPSVSLVAEPPVQTAQDAHEGARACTPPVPF